MSSELSSTPDMNENIIHGTSQLEQFLREIGIGMQHVNYVSESEFLTMVKDETAKRQVSLLI